MAADVPFSWVAEDAVYGVNGGVKTGHGAEQQSATVAPA
jgi:SRSO17 transposase